MHFLKVSTVVLGLCLTSTLAGVSRRYDRSVDIQKRSLGERDVSTFGKRAPRTGKQIVCPNSKLTASDAGSNQRRDDLKTGTTNSETDNGLIKRAKKQVEQDAVATTKDEIESTDMNGCSLVLVWADKLYAAHTSIGDLEEFYDKLANHHAQITHILIVTASNAQEDPDFAEMYNEIKDELQTNVKIQLDTYEAVIGGEDASYTLKAKWSRKGKFTKQKVA